MQEKPHILVVDDDREIRRLLGDYLEKNGYRSSTVPDGKGMRRALELSPPNLIVLDLMLPGEGGLNLLPEVEGDDRRVLPGDPLPADEDFAETRPPRAFCQSICASYPGRDCMVELN